MTKPITNYAELLEEKQRLKLLLQAQKELVRQDIREIKEELAPIKSAIDTAGKFLTKDKSNMLLTTAVDTIIDLVVKGMLLSKSGWITKLAVPFVMKNFSSHVIADNKDSILSKLFSWISGKKNANGQPQAHEEEMEEEEED